MSVTIRVPRDFRPDQMFDIGETLRYAIYALQVNPERLEEVRRISIRKPVRELKARISPSDFFHMRSWCITPGAIVTWFMTPRA